MKKVQDFQRRTPRQARARMTVDSILEAAAQVLERAGPDGFNTNAVAERAGVSVGTLYQYFPDKDAILLAVARRAIEAPQTSLHRTLMAALVRALENLLGRNAGAARNRRMAIKSDVDRILFAAEEFLLSWIALPMPMHRTVRVTRRS
jgi:AcrR family transcriptional regulator